MPIYALAIICDDAYDRTVHMYVSRMQHECMSFARRVITIMPRSIRLAVYPVGQNTRYFLRVEFFLQRFHT